MTNTTATNTTIISAPGRFTNTMDAAAITTDTKEMPITTAHSMDFAAKTSAKGHNGGYFLSWWGDDMVTALDEPDLFYEYHPMDAEVQDRMLPSVDNALYGNSEGGYIYSRCIFNVAPFFRPEFEPVRTFGSSDEFLKAYLGDRKAPAILPLRDADVQKAKDAGSVEMMTFMEYISPELHGAALEYLHVAMNAHALRVYEMLEEMSPAYIHHIEEKLDTDSHSVILNQIIDDVLEGVLFESLVQNRDLGLLLRDPNFVELFDAGWSLVIAYMIQLNLDFYGVVFADESK